MKRQYAVIGNPIDHSQSPYIHRLFADQCQQKLEYTAKLVAMNEFRVAADAFFQEGGHGLNVTIPFKQDACLLYTSPSPRDRTRSRMPSSA